jgi:lipopolysaccharide/colanic/teichoic acid biosynthesis glycosyltransferase
VLVIRKIIQPEDLHEQTEEMVLRFIQNEIETHHISIIAIDLVNPDIQKHLPALYALIFDGVRFINVQDLYENITDKVPLSLINEAWFLEHASIEPNFIYDAVKRIMDVCITLPLFIVPIVTYPFLWIIMKLTDRGPFYYGAERIGQGGKKIKIYKVRSMSVMDDGTQLGEHQHKITKLGKIIRVTRLDEFAQLWGVLKGDLSLIGPRPEFPKLVDLYNKEIPHYSVRHLIKPGLSGWAQIHHEKPPHTVEETMEKLAYDLYYIKNRSILLDLKIALQTIKTLLSRVGI